MLAERLDGLVRADAPLREEMSQIDEARSELDRQRLRSTPPRALEPARGHGLAAHVRPDLRARSRPGGSARELPEGLALEPRARRGCSCGTAPPWTAPCLPTTAPASIRSPSEASCPRYGAEMTRAARGWLDSLEGVTSVGRYNKLCASASVDELVRVVEGFHEK